MSCLYCLWDVIGELYLRFKASLLADRLVQMIPSHEKSTPQTPQPSQKFADVAHREVRSFLFVIIVLLTHPRSVWGVIWLIQALIFFAVGVIVGLVAFKVTPLTFYVLTDLTCGVIGKR
jgi:hypothetical protein